MTKRKRDGKYTHYSKLLGKHNDFLSCYKAHNKKLGFKTPEEWYNHIIERKHEQEIIIDKLQQIYYSLIDNRSLSKFSTYLFNLGIYGHKNCFFSTVQSAFMYKEGFIGLSAINKYKRIISIFETWRNTNV